MKRTKDNSSWEDRLIAQLRLDLEPHHERQDYVPERDDEFLEELEHYLEDRHTTSWLAWSRESFEDNTEKNIESIIDAYKRLEGDDAYERRRSAQIRKITSRKNASYPRKGKLPTADKLAAELAEIMKAEPNKRKARAALHRRYLDVSEAAINKKLKSLK